MFISLHCLWLRGGYPMDGAGKLGQEHRLLDSLRVHPIHSHLRIPVEGPVASGAVADTLPKVFLLAREGGADPSHGSRCQDEGTGLNCCIWRVNCLGVLFTVTVLTIDHEDLCAAVVGAVFDGLLSHLIEELFARHGPVHAGVIGNVRGDGQRSNSRILVEDHSLEVSPGRVERACAPRRSTADNGHVALDHLHLSHGHA
mmetsp:Transcript_39296/g.80156  ORF Transcript_39296/g.80156 Transcript_39296/m.80156 type:complete len:200 (-) Transcript_39296:242-841(-)